MSKTNDLEKRIKAIEDWVEEFERGCAEAEAELSELFSDETTIEFIADSSLLRDKTRDN